MDRVGGALHPNLDFRCAEHEMTAIRSIVKPFLAFLFFVFIGAVEGFADPLPTPNVLWPVPGDQSGVVLDTATGPWTVAQGTILADGAGGAWAVWANQYLGSGPHSSILYAARIGSSGQVSTKKTPLSSHAKASLIGVVRDDADGLIAIWQHVGLYYAQRLNGAGSRQWSPSTWSGIQIGLCPCAPGPVFVEPDGLGGAYLVVGDTVARVTADGDVQLGPANSGLKLTPSGEAVRFLQTADPMLVVETEPAPKAVPGDTAIIDPKILERLSQPLVGAFPPGAKIVAVPGGMMAGWYDLLSTQKKLRVHTQRIRGGFVGGPSSVEFPFADSIQRVMFEPDGSGGLFAVWLEQPATWVQNGLPRRIKVARVASNGQAAWSSPVTVFDASSQPKDWNAMELTARHIGGGRLAVAWTDHRYEATLAEQTAKGLPWKSNPDIRARVIDADGMASWPSDGVIISRDYNSSTPDADGSQGIPVIVGDGAGGAYFGYRDHAYFGADVGFTHLDAAGSKTSAGLIVKDDEANKEITQKSPGIDFDGKGPKQGPILIWQEFDSPYHRIVVQKVENK